MSKFLIKGVPTELHEAAKFINSMKYKMSDLKTLKEYEFEFIFERADELGVKKIKEYLSFIGCYTRGAKCLKS